MRTLNKVSQQHLDSSWALSPTSQHVCRDHRVPVELLRPFIREGLIPRLPPAFSFRLPFAYARCPAGRPASFPSSLHVQWARGRERRPSSADETLRGTVRKELAEELRGEGRVHWSPATGVWGCPSVVEVSNSVRGTVDAKPWYKSELPRPKLSPSYTDLPNSQTSSMDQSKYYITGAFVLGATLAILYQTISSNSTSEHGSSEQQLKQQRILISRLSKIDDLQTLKKSLAEIETTLEKGGGNIKEGIEGCIGGTPLIKIKSLSDATGCEILVKAEV
jgi:hypothetical protein